MRKNVAGQVVSAHLIATADGSDVTSGTTTVYVTGDGGTQGSGGTATHEGNGCWTFLPSQANTNYDHVVFTFENSSAINVDIQVYPVSYDPTDAVRMGLTALPNVNAGSAGGLPTDTDVNGAVRIVDGTNPREINTNAGAIALVDLVTTSTNNTDVNAKLGTMTDLGSGSSVANNLADLAGTGFLSSTDSQEAIRNRGDAEWITATGFSTHAAGDVWGVDATTQQTQGTFGQAIGDPVADTTTIYQAVATDAAGDNVAIDVIAVKAETASIQAETTPILADTADMQPKLGTPAGTDISADIAAVKAETASIQAETTPILADTADMQPKLGTPAGASISADIAALNNISTADVLTQANAALDTALVELTQGVPDVTPTTRTALMALYHALTNRLDVDTSGTDEIAFYNSSGTKIFKKLVTDDGTTYSEATAISGA